MLKYSPVLENFEALQKIFRQNDFHPGIGVEVGVRNGDCAEYLLRNNPGLCLYAVDPYLAYKDVSHEYTQDEQDRIRDAAQVRLYDFEFSSARESHIIWAYLPSVEAANVFSAGEHAKKFDFIFVDANHEFSAVRDDLSAWAPLIRSGGILAGHDFSMDGVKKAVFEWMDENSYKECLLRTDPSVDVWAIQLR
jgi:hypothetical protein